jgi:ATP/ADP translocase
VSWLERLLHLSPWTIRHAIRAALWHLIFVATVTINKSASNAVFLSRADSQHLPWLYVIVALVITIVSSFLSQKMALWNLHKILLWGVSVSLAVVSCAGIAVLLQVPWATGLFYVAAEVSATVGSVLFWSRMMDSFPLREQKRVVGILSAGGMLGAIFGGGLVSVLVSYGGAILPSLIASWLPIVTAPLFLRMRVRTKVHSQEKAPWHEIIAYVKKHQLSRRIAWIVAIFASLGASIDYVFRTSAALRYSEESMANIFGLLNMWVGVAMVVFQIGLTPWLLNRFGLFIFASLIPLAVLILGILWLIIPSPFIVIMMMKGVEMAGAFSIMQAAVALLYNPIPEAYKSKVRSLIDGSVKKMGAALAGILLVQLQLKEYPASGIVVICMTSIVLLIMIKRIRVDYLAALNSMLVPHKKLNLKSQLVDLSDKTTAAAIMSVFHQAEHEDETRLVNLLELIPRDHQMDLASIVQLLKHPSEQVRSLILHRIPRQPDVVLSKELLKLADPASPGTIRSIALTSLLKTSPQTIPLEVIAYIEDEDPLVTCAAIYVCLTIEPHHGRARNKLDALMLRLETLSKEWRAQLARLLGRLEDVRYDNVLLKLLDDPDRVVQEQAIRAAGREKHLAHIEKLISMLAHKTLRFHVSNALVAYGDHGVEALVGMMDNKDVSLVARIHVPAVLSRIATPMAAQGLLFSNPRDDAYLQSRISKALVDIHKKNPDIMINTERTQAAIERRVQAYHYYVDLLLHLEGTSPAIRLLKKTIYQRAIQNLRIALELVGIHKGIESMMNVFSRLKRRTCTG